MAALQQSKRGDISPPCKAVELYGNRRGLARPGNSQRTTTGLAATLVIGLLAGRAVVTLTSIIWCGPRLRRRCPLSGRDARLERGDLGEVLPLDVHQTEIAVLRSAGLTKSDADRVPSVVTLGQVAALELRLQAGSNVDMRDPAGLVLDEVCWLLGQSPHLLLSESEMDKAPGGARRHIISHFHLNVKWITSGLTYSIFLTFTSRIAISKAILLSKHIQIRKCETMSELPEKQAKRLHALIQEAETNLAAAKELLISIIGDDGAIITPKGSTHDEVGGKVIEGVFDGQKMAGPDGKEYPVPANYASKSKLVEGDILKLTIADDGSFIYKQIGPVERTQVIGTLVQHDGAYYVEANGREYRILLASVTYFRINVGDQVTIIVPTDNPDATWAAVEAAL